MRPIRVLAHVCFLAGVAVAASGTQARPLTVDDWFGLAHVRNVTISPDGARVAYTVSTTDLEADRTESALWLAPSDPATGSPWRLTAPGYSAGSPRFSPDGRLLAFLASRRVRPDDEDPVTQVWAFDLRGGDALPLTEIAQGVDDFVFSPDGARLLLTLTDPKPELLQGDAARGEKKPEPFVIDRLQFKRDRQGYLDRRRSHLYVQPVTGGTPRQITSGDYDDAGAAWSPDGKLVVFSSNRTDEPDGNDNTDLWVVAADNTDQGETMRRLTDNPGPDFAPAWSPDGTTITYLTGIEPALLWYATTHLAVIDASGAGPARVLTRSLDRNVSSPRFTPDGEAVLVLLEDSGAQHVARIDVRDGRVSRLVAGDRAVRQLSTAAKGSMALLLSTPHLPSEVFLVDEAGDLRQLSQVNTAWREAVTLGEVRNVTFPSADGTEIEGFLTLPPGWDARLRYPTLLRIHGGPTSQYDFRFDFESQLFAAHGYVVVRSNPRGSTGYGQDFAKAIFADWGNLDYQDVMAAVDHAVAQGYADPNRLGVGGWSYGGILTNYVITQTDRFEAAITGASEVLYIANYGHDHYQLQWEQELGLPWENREAWERISPFNRVEKITTPTLILCGQLDWNVPVQNSEQLYQALKRLGRTTELVVYPGESHGIRKPTFQKDRLERYLDWYDRFVKAAPAAAAPAP